MAVTQSRVRQTSWRTRKAVLGVSSLGHSITSTWTNCTRIPAFKIRDILHCLSLSYHLHRRLCSVRPCISRARHDVPPRLGRRDSSEAPQTRRLAESGPIFGATGRVECRPRARIWLPSPDMVQILRSQSTRRHQGHTTRCRRGRHSPGLKITKASAQGQLGDVDCLSVAYQPHSKPIPRTRQYCTDMFSPSDRSSPTRWQTKVDYTLNRYSYLEAVWYSRCGPRPLPKKKKKESPKS